MLDEQLDESEIYHIRKQKLIINKDKLSWKKKYC